VIWEVKLMIMKGSYVIMNFICAYNTMMVSSCRGSSTSVSYVAETPWYLRNVSGGSCTHGGFMTSPAAEVRLEFGRGKMLKIQACD
jgi:hypothetical protein